MDRLRCFIAALLWVCATSAFGAPRSTLPNILILYADDLGYGDVHCYNPNRGRIPTPHIDAFASQGMRFTDAHSSSAVCSPSRYTLLTGRYHWRTRLQRGIVGLWGAPLISPERMTIGSLAKRHGYRTACIGKWHLGWNWPISEDQKPFMRSPSGNSSKPVAATEKHRAVWKTVFSQPLTGGPTSVGFDEYFGTDVPNWPPYCFIRDDRTVGIPSDFLPPELLKRNQASRQGPALPDWSLQKVLPAIEERAVKFIEQASVSSQPFLLYVPLTSPHTPLAVVPEWKGRSGLGQYADFVMQTDAVVGRVLQALKGSALEQNTLVLFTSDNGCAPYIGVADLERNGHFPSGPLRGYKADAWEGGHRVPFIVRWPGIVSAGTICDQLVHQADLLMTIADILGASLPDNAAEDSFSLLPLLHGSEQPVRETAVSCSIHGIPALRSGQWKYIAASGSGGWSKGSSGSGPVQLYDLTHDIGETDNLAEAQPQQVMKMQQILEKIITNGRSNPGAPQHNEVKVVRHPKTAARRQKPSQ